MTYEQAEASQSQLTEKPTPWANISAEANSPSANPALRNGGDNRKKEEPTQLDVTPIFNLERSEDSLPFQTDQNSERREMLGPRISTQSGDVTAEQRDAGNPRSDVTSAVSPDGTLVASWPDGRQLVRRVNADGTVTSVMHGPQPYQRFTATEHPNGNIEIKYADGSTASQQNGRWTTTGVYGDIRDRWVSSSSGFHLSTAAQLLTNHYINLSTFYGQVRRDLERDLNRINRH
jgi:hypothetical protein